MDDKYGNSVVVRQFMAIVRGEVKVHEPVNEFSTVTVEVEELYCLRCCDVRHWDTWHGCQDGLTFVIGRCQCCGQEKTL